MGFERTKVLQLVGHLGCGGDTTAIMNAIHGFKDDSIDVDFITHSGCDDSFVEMLRKEGHRVVVLDGDFRKLKFKYSTTVENAIRSLDTNYDVFHAHTSLQSGLALKVAKKLGIPKRICHSHVGAIQRRTSFAQRAVLESPLRKECVQNSTLLVACSRAAGDFLFKDNPYRLLYNGVDVSASDSVSNRDCISFRNEIGCPSDAILIGQVARFSSMKNQLFTLDLARNLKNSDKYFFVFVGEGSSFNKIQEKAAEYGLLNTSFIGRRDDMACIMKSLDCLLLPSLPGEGFPMTILEGVSAGTRCLISENVTEEVLMLGPALVTRLPLDGKRWAEQIHALHHKDKAQIDLGQNAMIDNGLDLGTFSEKWERMYR